MSSGAAGLWEGPSPREPFPCSDLREGSPHPRSSVAERSALSELEFSGARLQWSFSSGTPDRVSLTRPRSRRRGSNPHPGLEAGPEAGRDRSHAGPPHGLGPRCRQRRGQGLYWEKGKDLPKVNLGLPGVGDNGGGQKRSLREERKCTKVGAVGVFLFCFWWWWWWWW